MSENKESTADNAPRSGWRNRLISGAIIIVTLIFGMVLGGLVTARIVQNRFDRIAQVRNERGFIRFLERNIDFENDEQRRQVRAILDDTSDRMFDHLRTSRREARAILDSARTQLDDVLSDEQMEQIERHLRRRGPPGLMHDGRPMHDGGPMRDRRPPPPGGPPNP